MEARRKGHDSVTPCPIEFLDARPCTEQFPSDLVFGEKFMKKLSANAIIARLIARVGSGELDRERVQADTEGLYAGIRNPSGFEAEERKSIRLQQ